MTEPDDSPRYSPLCQSMTRDGKTVQVCIYGDGEGGWLLEVIDEYGNSSVWDDPFATDQSALDELLKTISEEGIASLIGSPSEGLPMTGPNQSLSGAELVELDEFLGSEANERMGVSIRRQANFLYEFVSLEVGAYSRSAEVGER